MPTPKQVRYHYKKIYDLHSKLSKALCQAHEAGVIEYEQDKYVDQSPCSSLYHVDIRIDKTTEKALANAMRTEILRGKR